MHITSVEHGYSAPTRSSVRTCRSRAGSAWASGCARRRGHRVLLRRRRDEHRRLPRGGELAAIWRLPVALRVREQPVHGVHGDRLDVIAGVGAAADRARLRPAVVVDGNDVDAVREVARRGRRGPAGGGPALVEADDLPAAGPFARPTRRPTGPAEEVERWRRGRADRPLPRAVLDGARGPEAATRSTPEVGAEVTAVAERARAHRPPETATRSGPTCGATGDPDGAIDLSRRGVAALAQEMRRDSASCCWARTSAPAGCSRRRPGLGTGSAATGCGTPRSRSRRSSARAMGAAMAGLRPVAEIMFSDFYATCWDQVVNEVAKTRYMTGGQVTLPLVLRGANGGRQHGVRQSARPVLRELGDDACPGSRWSARRRPPT